MMTQLKRFPLVRRGLGALVLAATAAMLPGTASAFQSLNLDPTQRPDITSPNVVVDYSVTAGGIGTLNAMGNADLFRNPPNADVSLVAAMLNIDAIINNNTNSATGNFSITENNGADTLLGGTLATFGVGAGAGSPLEFIFNVTSGSLASFFPTAGIILSNTGYQGSLTNLPGFSNLNGDATANTIALVSAPQTLALMLGGFWLIAAARRRQAEG